MARKVWYVRNKNKLNAVEEPVSSSNFIDCKA